MEKVVLGIETSCDETAAAVVAGGRRILSNVVSSQIPIHRKYGGVVPEIASRKHITAILPVVDAALKEAEVGFDEIDLVAVTHSPGLIGGLLVGLSFAKTLAYALDKPLVCVNHLEGHIFANFLESDLKPPFLSLVVSGGHTLLARVKDYEDIEILGSTRDDAAGEAFDKVARALGLPYPGGPMIEKTAKGGNPFAIEFPQSLMQEGNWEFSFSGLKSAVLNYLNKMKMKGEEIPLKDVAASFEMCVVDTLAKKAVEAAKHLGERVIVIGGGVAANTALRNRIKELADDAGIALHCPPPHLATDNAAMIAARGYYQHRAMDPADRAL